MPDGDKLSLLLVDGGRDRLLAAINLGASALALGQTVQFFLAWEALRRVVTGGMAAAPLPASLPPEAQTRIEAELAEQTPLDEALQELRRQGAKVYACSNTLHMLGLAEAEVTAYVDGVSGATGFLAMASAGRVLSF